MIFRIVSMERLRSSSHHFGQKILSRHNDGVVILNGRVDTYYHKQMAQELLRKLEGVERVINLLEVHWDDRDAVSDFLSDATDHEHELALAR
ncbi:MAG: BON domain-containing protein [Pirellulales bacterium]